MIFSNRALMLVLAVMVTASYFNSVSGSFQFDDYNVIVNNNAVHSFNQFLIDIPHSIRPLLKLSYMINYILSPEPELFHLVNIIIHLSNTLLVFFFIRIVLNSQVSETHNYVQLNSFFASAMFGLHPLATESVTYICGRSNSMMALFYLAALMFFIKARKQENPLCYLAVMNMLFAAAVTVKESGVTFPAAILLIDIIILKKFSLRDFIKFHAPSWFVLAAFFVMFMIQPRYRALIETSSSLRTASENIFSQVLALGYLLNKTFLPVNQSIDPSIPIKTSFSAEMLIPMMLIFALIMSAFILKKSNPLVSFSIIWIFLHLSPTNSIIPRLDLVNERQMYLPMVGVTLLIVTIYAKINPLKRFPAFSAGVGSVVIMTLSLLTVMRNTDYRSEITLWTQTASVSPENPRAFNNLGYAEFISGNHEKAIECYRKALLLSPGYIKAKENIESAKMAYTKGVLLKLDNNRLLHKKQH